MLRVGLTGGTGAGKTTAATRLGRLGAVVVDADALAREVVAPGTPGLRAVAREFGGGVLTGQGSLDRAALGAVVFADPVRRRALEAITHPLVAARRGELLAASPDDAVVVDDIPLLVETGRAAEWPLVLVVDAPADVRVARLVGSRGMSAQDARSRVAAQADDTARRAAADVLLVNTGSTGELVSAVDTLWHERLVPFEENLRLGRRAARPTAPVLVDPDPTWPEQAGRLLARIRRVAGDRALSVEHVGPTAVPGLPAEDCLDVQVVTDDLRTAGQLAGELGPAGLVPGQGERWDEPALRLGSRSRSRSRSPRVVALGADPARRVTCHLRAAADPEVARVLDLRERLRADAGDRAAYADLERRLAHEHADVDACAAARTAFLAGVLARARA